MDDYFSPPDGAELDWDGWGPWTGMTQADYFRGEEVGCRCRGPCEKCGFYYLNEIGGPLKREETPLCGTW
jgi:hypothetical protein